MRSPLVVGILREAKPGEARAPLTPHDAAWLRKRKIEIEVESNPARIFKDAEYQKAGARVVDRFRKASLLVGIKEPEVSSVYPDRIYSIFSHTIKGQSQNMSLLKECLRKNITLVDYERIVDARGGRLVYFGRLAGIAGAVDSLHFLGRKLESEGIENPFTGLKPAHQYRSYSFIKKDLRMVAANIAKNGFPKEISPFVIGITGHGNVSKGANEALSFLDPIEIHPKDMGRFVRHQKHVRDRVYKIVLHREEKFRSKTGAGYYFEEYLAHPERFESNIDTYLPHISVLIHASYWDSRYPRLFTKKMAGALYGGSFKLKFIGDISCDVGGSIEITRKTTTIDAPVFTYDPKKRRYWDGWEGGGISIMARDNLPAEMPRDASRDFGGLLREYVYQLAAHGAKDITNHVAIPKEIRGAVITQARRLTPDYKYLERYLR